MAYSTIDDPTNFFRIKLYNGNNNAQNIAWDETDSNTSTNMESSLKEFEHISDIDEDVKPIKALRPTFAKLDSCLGIFVFK